LIYIFKKTNKQKMMKSILILAALTVAATVSAADVTVLNTGSKTGGFSVESGAYAKDLAASRSVDFVSPGQYCAAYAILSKATTPMLFPWASDFEAAGRDGAGCATVAFKDAEVVRYNSDSMRVCSIDPAFTAVGFVKKGVGSRVGHTTPDYAFARAVQAVNQSFGTKHRPVTYNGTGDLKTALINGEVDYGFFTAKWVKEVVAAGGECHYVMNSAGADGLTGLNAKDPANRFLTVGYDTVWLMINADAKAVAQVKSDMISAHANTASAINTATHNTLKINWDQSAEDIRSSWEKAVNAMRK
jgi:hypothetical protein